MTTGERNALTVEQRQALDVARALARAGIPIFVAPPDPASKSGFALPRQWQRTEPDPAVVDRWVPGMALCAVMGAGLDLIDIDPRNGGDPAAMDGAIPRSYAAALTPSGGMHSFIRSVGAGSHDNVYPGIDIKGGFPDGTSRGFAYLAPTVRPSKITGEPVAYRWIHWPQLSTLGQPDTSGAALATRITEIRARTGGQHGATGGPEWWQRFMRDREPQAQAAAERAMAAKLAEVERWTPDGGAGFRATLMRAALTLGGYVGGGYLGDAVARQRLEAAVSAVWGTPDADDLRWIDQGLADGALRPFFVYTPADELVWGGSTGEDPECTEEVGPVDPPRPPWTIYSAIGTHPFDPYGISSDQELAEAVAARMVPGLRFGEDSGTWLIRGAHVWHEREDLSTWAVAQLTRLMPLGEHPVPKDPGERTEGHWQAVRRAQFISARGASAIVSKLRAIVRCDHPLGVELARLDTDPEVLWAGGLPWNLRASREMPVVARLDPATPHLRTAWCAPAPVPTPYWDAFLATVWPDPDVRAWALRVLSITLTGYPDAALPVLYGPQRTGKTSLVTLLVSLLGSYGHAADPRLLGAADTTHASVIHALKGRRLSFIDEGPRKGHLATERLKQLTGGGPLTGNAMRANPITFSPTHTLVMTTNDEPPITDPALRARMRIIPCEADEKAVRAAREALSPVVWHAEAPGALAALMTECAAWLADRGSAGNPAAPVEIRAAVEDMAARQDPVREWVELCTVPAQPGTPGRELYRHFAAWHDACALYRRGGVPSETAFGRALTRLGFPPTKHGTGHDRLWYRALSVLGGYSGYSGIHPNSPVSGGVGSADAGLGKAAHNQYSGRPHGEASPSVPDDHSDIHPDGPAPSETRSSEAESSEAALTQYSGRLGGFEPGWAGSSFKPAQPENPSSGWELSDLEPGWAGFSRSSATAFQNSPKWGTDNETTAGKGAPNPPTPKSEEGTGSDLGLKGGRVAKPKPAQGHEKVTKKPNADRYGDTPGDTPKSSPSVTEESASNINGTPDADSDKPDKITKAEAAARLKVEARDAAIREACGDVLPLPVVVDRAGHLLPVTPEQAAVVVRAALGRTGGALTVDVETTGYPPGHQLYALRSVQLGDEVAAVVWHPSEHAELIRTLLAEAAVLHAHSATADLVPLAMAGLIDPDTGWARMYDTVIPAKLADPRCTGSDPGLKGLSAAVLGDGAVSPAADSAREAAFKAAKWLTAVGLDTPLERGGWAQINTGCATMLRYAASDVLDTAALARRLPLPDPAVLHRERTAQEMTARITHHGWRIDPGRVRELTGEHETARAEAASRVCAHGIENPGSTAQVARALAQLGAALPVSDKGNPSVAEHVLSLLARSEGDPGRLARAVLDYRHSSTVLNLFLEPYRQLCELGDGRARPTVYTLGADTGRTTCVRPNAQQLSREGGIRSMYVADPGYVFISADFSGVELRGAAALSQDPVMLRLLAEGRDLHAEVALAAFGPDPDASAQVGYSVPRKADRYTAKRAVFGYLYGGGITTLARQVGVPETEMAAIVDSLKALTPGLAAWSDALRRGVRQGYTQFRSYSGRVIHLPREYPHKATNYAIQGSCRELLVDALIRWRDTRWGTCTLLPVHDELIVQVPAEDTEVATCELVRCMESSLYGVAIKADPGKRETWGSPYWRDSA